REARRERALHVLVAGGGGVERRPELVELRQPLERLLARAVLDQPAAGEPQAADGGGVDGHGGGEQRREQPPDERAAVGRGSGSAPRQPGKARAPRDAIGRAPAGPAVAGPRKHGSLPAASAAPPAPAGARSGD